MNGKTIVLVACVMALAMVAVSAPVASAHHIGDWDRFEWRGDANLIIVYCEFHPFYASHALWDGPLKNCYF